MSTIHTNNFAIPRSNGIELNGTLFTTYHNLPMTCFDVTNDSVVVATSRVCTIYTQSTVNLRLSPSGECRYVSLVRGRLFYAMQIESHCIVCSCDYETNTTLHTIYGKATAMVGPHAVVKTSNHTLNLYVYTVTDLYRSRPEQVRFTRPIDKVIGSSDYICTNHQAYDIEGLELLDVSTLRGDILFVGNGGEEPYEYIVTDMGELWCREFEDEPTDYRLVANEVVGYVVGELSLLYPVVREWSGQGYTYSIISPTTGQLLVGDIGEINTSSLSTTDR